MYAYGLGFGVASFSAWLGARELLESSSPAGTAARYVHRDGRGLMNNSSLDYGRLDDDEAMEVEDEMLGMRQPPRELHGSDLVFVFTPEGEARHSRLIALLTKASRTGVRRVDVPLSGMEVVWDSGDGQLALKRG